MTLIEQFSQDPQGRRYSDVMNEQRIALEVALNLLEQPDSLRRMKESELNHGHPALAGVVKDLEELRVIKDLFETTDSHDTERFRQAIGVAVRIVMENDGWIKTGSKGLLGTREKVEPHTTTPGAYHNKKGSLSKWFTRAERYEPRKD